VVAPIVAIVYEAMVDGTWERLKVCPADDCQWAFYDESKNRSGTWCDMAVCGNRAKVRAYRERRIRARSRS
jgi:predicted RNA-binding Zn ribbon-like protein